MFVLAIVSAIFGVISAVCSLGIAIVKLVTACIRKANKS